MTLTDQERRAINEFLGEHWSAFMQVAERYLEEEDIEALGERLAEQ